MRWHAVEYDERVRRYFIVRMNDAGRFLPVRDDKGKIVYYDDPDTALLESDIMNARAEEE